MANFINNVQPLDVDPRSSRKHWAGSNPDVPDAHAMFQQSPVYVAGRATANSCGDDVLISEESECKSASTALGKLPYHASDSWGNAPRGCIFDVRGTFYNKHATGGCSGNCGSLGMTPICVRRSKNNRAAGQTIRGHSTFSHARAGSHVASNPEEPNLDLPIGKNVAVFIIGLHRERTTAAISSVQQHVIRHLNNAHVFVHTSAGANETEEDIKRVYTAIIGKTQLRTVVVTNKSDALVDSPDLLRLQADELPLSDDAQECFASSAGPFCVNATAAGGISSTALAALRGRALMPFMLIAERQHKVRYSHVIRLRTDTVWEHDWANYSVLLSLVPATSSTLAVERVGAVMVDQWIAARSIAWVLNTVIPLKLLLDVDLRAVFDSLGCRDALQRLAGAPGAEVDGPEWAPESRSRTLPGTPEVDSVPVLLSGFLSFCFFPVYGSDGLYPETHYLHRIVEGFGDGGVRFVDPCTVTGEYRTVRNSAHGHPNAVLKHCNGARGGSEEGRDLPASSDVAVRKETRGEDDRLQEEEKTSVNDEFVGRLLSVYWAHDDRWYRARVVSLDPSSGAHVVEYDDGEQEIFDVAVADHRFLRLE